MKESIIIKRLVSIDGETKKYLFKLKDGQTVESVLMKCSHGFTICISTQVGCKMSCSFCVTGKGGFGRNLTPSEMVSQIEEIQDREGIKVTCVVLMGMGEPLDNYENVLKFIEIATNSNRLDINPERITISTCGLVDKIYELAKLKPLFNLAVSLHATNDEIRNKIMKINKKWNISELLKACKYYTIQTNKSILFEYVMINNLNDSVNDAHEMVRLLKDIPCRVDLIPANDSGNEEFKASSLFNITAFIDILKGEGINASVRGTVGGDINAACGQLKARNEENNY